MENRRDVEKAMREFDQLSEEGKKIALEYLLEESLRDLQRGKDGGIIRAEVVR